ncbi:MAG: pantothenate kinase [Symploca sp. SIO3E6]|nr:pantothenate kinase [Caldora sp. SIO3E6]
MIGNSRLHWALFVDDTLTAAWDTNHLSAAVVEQLLQDWASGIMPAAILPPQLQWEFPSAKRQEAGGRRQEAGGRREAFSSCITGGLLSPRCTSQLPLYIASVVPAQTKLWQNYPTAQVITLADLPLQELYPTLGIDRALAVLGAGETYGYPVLMIDAGTALTFTGANAQRQLIGGAILPGLGLQLKSLAQKTAALPATQLPSQLPTRWAMETPGAIESGVIYTVLAGIQDFIANWQQQFPDTQIALTGGDSDLLLKYLQVKFPETAAQIIADPHLIFRGMGKLIINNY